MARRQVMTTRRNLCRIVPARHDHGGPTLCNGTKVILADGSELPGIMKISIHGEANSVWIAKIEVMVEPPDLPDVIALIEANSVPAPSEEESFEFPEHPEDFVGHSSGATIKPPEMPPSRVEHQFLFGVLRFKSQEELDWWRAEPLWRRMFGLTKYDERLRKGNSQ